MSLVNIMSSPKSVSFNRRLSELNQWQIEQDSKLKDFQESKKKLLNFEFDNIWKSISVSKEKLTDSRKDDSSNKENQAPILKGPSFVESRERLDDGCASDRDAKDLEKKIEEENDGLRNGGGQWRESVVGSKTFLRRGDGLKRFRMTLEDFKAPPKIYRDQHMKVLNKKTEPRKKQALLTDRVEHASKCRPNTYINAVKTAGKKRTGIAVNIYVKGDKCGGKASLENSSKEVTIKAGSSNNLKDFSCVKSNFSARKGLDKEVVPDSRGKLCRKTVVQSPIDACLNSDIENRRDENELKIFEILEEKVNESSFCSSSSLIDKLLNPHRGGNAAVGSSRRLETATHESEVSKSTCFVPVPFGSPGGLEVVPTAAESLSTVLRVPNDQFETGAHSRECLRADFAETGAGEETVDKLELRTAKVAQSSPKTPASRKNVVERRVADQRFESPRDDYQVFVPPAKSDLVPGFGQKEMAAKLRRKGLQDNVKLLMNWDGSPRKKCVKKNVVRKSKPKFKKQEKPKSSCREETEKVVFNSTLLKERLNELEREILIFRKENSALERMKRECQEERTRLVKEKKEFEKHMEVEKNSLVTALAEDRKKLQKERLVFETYCKEARSRPSREERQQISCLKRDLEKMAETLATKEARWGASQARLRNQIRTLEGENGRLRAENEKLKNAGPKRVSFGSGKALNAKIIRAVNTELDRLNHRTGTGLVRGCNCGGCQAPGSRSCPEQEKKKPLRRIMSAPNMKESKTSGSRSATPDPETQTLSGYSGGVEQSLPGSDDSDEDACDESESERLVDEADKSHDRGAGQDVDVVNAAVRDGPIEKLGSRGPRSSHFSSIPKSCLKGTEDSENSLPGTAAAVDKNLSAESLYRHPFPRRGESRTREKSLEDGTREIIYPNGNVKRIFPDNKIVRILYYNGDVKEIDFEEGNEKYYYSETQTWHMSYRDGMDVVEFPTGQTERRYPDGSSEISFPNGCVRYCDASGRDEWRFPDGTVMKTNEKGHKVLIMANGQKEIRTNEFKQREYPDGTIKIVYSNGTQETRYASGRVRLKDGDGNLVMDTGGERL